MNSVPTDTYARSGVYRPDFPGVKWNVGSVIQVVLTPQLAIPIAFLALTLPLAGCSQHQRPEEFDKHECLLGAWYSVENARAVGAGNLEARLEQDFSRMGKMGLNTVLLRHCDKFDLPLALAAATRHGLRTVVCDHRAMRYVRSGSGNASFSGANTIPDQETTKQRYVGRIVDDVTASRCERVIVSASPRAHAIRAVVCSGMQMLQRLLALDSDVLILADSMPDGEVCGLGTTSSMMLIQTIRCLQHRKDELMTVRQWLGEFHEGLASGRVGGVVFDAYRSSSCNWSGLVIGNSPPSAERSALLRRIAARSKCWNPKLEGLVPQTISPLSGGSPSTRSTLFSGPRRQYLLIVNHSSTKFVRTALCYQTALGEKSIVRAVEVPSSSHSQLGTVLEPANDVLRIPVNISPGDALLYELF